MEGLAITHNSDKPVNESSLAEINPPDKTTIGNLPPKDGKEVSTKAGKGRVVQKNYVLNDTAALKKKI